MEEQKEQEVDMDWLENVADQGFENMNSSDVTIPMLLIAQQLSEVVSGGSVKVGHFYNTNTGKDYGDEVNLVVCGFQKCWIEWMPNGGGFVARHEVGSIPITGDIYTGMKYNGNDIIETWMYAVVLPEHLEDGVMLFQSTRGNLKYLKAWNTQMKYLKTPQGNPAPIYSSVWNLKTNPDQNKKGQKYYSCNVNGKSSITRLGWTPGYVYKQYVVPIRQETVLAIADKTNQQQAIEADVTADSSDY